MTERERERERQTDRQIDRQTDRERNESSVAYWVVGKDRTRKKSKKKTNKQPTPRVWRRRVANEWPVGGRLGWGYRWAPALTECAPHSPFRSPRTRWSSLWCGISLRATPRYLFHADARQRSSVSVQRASRNTAANRSHQVSLG